MDEKKKNIAFIAESCGVSPMTVSRALRNNVKVKEATRRKILDFAEKINYHVGIKSGRPRKAANARPCVDVVVGVPDGSQSLFYSELISSIEACLSARGYDCLLRICDGEYERFMTLKETLSSSSAKACLLVGYFTVDQLQAFTSLCHGVVLVDHPGDRRLEAPYDSISFDNIEAARIAMKHLFKNNRKRIALVRGPLSHYFSREIEEGYRSALEDNEISLDNSLILEADFSPTGACVAINQALKDGIEFDAVFTNDEMAGGVYRALYQNNLKIPDDVAVCGCDGLSVGLQLFPQLTTVALDYKELGEIAVNSALENKDSGNRSPRRLRLMPRLEQRESV